MECCKDFSQLLQSLPVQVQRLYKEGLITKDELLKRTTKGYSAGLSAFLHGYYDWRKRQIYEEESKLRKYFPNLVATGRSFRINPILRKTIANDTYKRYKFKRVSLEEELEKLKKLF